MRRTWSTSLAMVAVACLAAPPAARAQLGNPTIFSETIPNADVQMGLAAAKPLYQNADAHPGQTVEWTTPETGHKGRATLVRDAELQGMSCRNIRYEFLIDTPSEMQTYAVNWCLTPDKTWRILN